ncbi:MAG TPA: hypothetical protein VNW54_00735 [Granulicella sp.]|jgi:hypothetical protein|nr:hypothetical protein [Granulicella sp.]
MTQFLILQRSIISRMATGIDRDRPVLTVDIAPQPRAAALTKF